MQDMKGFCDKCPTKSICSQLCPEAELYVNQDNVPLREGVRLGLPRHGKLWDGVNTPIRLTEKQAEIIALRLQGFTVNEIMERLKITRRAFDHLTAAVREKIRTRLDPDYEGPETHRKKEEDETDVPWTERIELSRTNSCGQVITDAKHDE